MDDQKLCYSCVLTWIVHVSAKQSMCIESCTEVQLTSIQISNSEVKCTEVQIDRCADADGSVVQEEARQNLPEGAWPARCMRPRSCKIMPSTQSMSAPHFALPNRASTGHKSSCGTCTWQRLITWVSLCITSCWCLQGSRICQSVGVSSQELHGIPAICRYPFQMGNANAMHAAMMAEAKIQAL